MFNDLPDDQMPPGLRELMGALEKGEVEGIHAIRVPSGLAVDGDIPTWALLLLAKLDEISGRLGYVEGIHKVMEAKALITPGHREALNFIYARKSFEAADGLKDTVEAGNELIQTIKELEATGLANNIEGMADRLRAEMDSLLAELKKTLEKGEGCGDN